MGKPSPFRKGESWKTGSQDKVDRMKAYLDWILTPAADRMPSTKKEFAESIGVTVQTLWNYEKETFFQKEIDKQSRGLFKASRMPDVIDTLFRIATDDSSKNAVSAARLLMDWQSRIVDDDETDYTGLSKEQLEELLNGAITET